MSLDDAADTIATLRRERDEARAIARRLRNLFARRTGGSRVALIREFDALPWANKE